MACHPIDSVASKTFKKLIECKAEFYVAVLTAIGIVFTYYIYIYIIVLLGLTLKSSIKLHYDNIGAVRYANNWSVGVKCLLT